MRIGFWSSITALVAGAGMALAQAPVTRSTVAEVPPPNGAGAPALSAHGAPDMACAPSCSFELPPWENYRFWGRAEYLIWRFDEAAVPNLGTNFTFPVIVQTVQITNTNGVNTAVTVLNNNFAAQVQTNPIVAGGPDIDQQSHPGVRFTVGAWLDAGKELGIEASGFGLSQRSTGLGVASSVSPPDRFNVDTGLTDSITTVTTSALGSQTQLQTFPVILNAATVTGVTATQTSLMFGGELNARTRAVAIGSLSFDGLLGLRYLELRDDFTSSQSFQLFLTNTARIRTAGLGLADMQDQLDIVASDSIRARNKFYGTQFGASFDLVVNRLIINGSAKFSAGTMHQSVDVLGSGTVTRTTTAIPVGGGVPTVIGPTTTPLGGGLLALPTDQGHHSRYRFAVAPQLGITVGWMLTDRVRVFAGYDYLYMNNVLRSTQQIGASTASTTVTIVQPVNLGLQRQTFSFQDTDFNAHGGNFGVEIRF